MKTFAINEIDSLLKAGPAFNLTGCLSGARMHDIARKEDQTVYLFKENGEIVISISGKVSKGKWEPVPGGSLFILSIAEESILVEPAFSDEEILILRLYNTNEAVILIKGGRLSELPAPTFQSIVNYLKERYSSKGLPASGTAAAKSGHGRKIWLAAGLAFLIMSLPFFARSGMLRKEAVKIRQMNEVRAENRLNQADTYSTMGIIWIVIGGVALAVGLTGRAR